MEEARRNGARLATIYECALHALHGLDFADLITEIHMLFKDEGIRDRWAKKFKYINIDEVQDTNELEYRIISRIFGTSSILLCGDYFQTIYVWRGSNPSAVRKLFVDECHPKEYIFYENYLATRLLLRASYDYIPFLAKAHGFNRGMKPEHKYIF